MDAIHILEEDHKAAKKVMDQILASSGAKRRELFRALQASLETHDWIEESIFYPAVKKIPKTSSFPEIDKKAHEEIEAALAGLDELPIDDDDDAVWIAQFIGMQAKLLQHVAEEEKDFFPKIRAILTLAELHELGSRLKAGKELRSKVAAVA